MSNVPLRNLTFEKSRQYESSDCQYLRSKIKHSHFKMKKRFLLFAFIASLAVSAAAQATDHAWLETSQLKVRINADGRLFCDDEKGTFLVPHEDSTVSLMRGAGLWFGGIDPGNNLLVSAQTQDPVKTDFVAGLRGIPNSGKVWKVTRAEIEAHRRDYLDNWVVDYPISSIFGWPARDNPFFVENNGFSWPDSMAKFDFFDEGTWNGKYEPHRGEFPFLGIRLFDGNWWIPNEMACFVYYTDGSQLLSKNADPYPVQVWGQAFVYDCPENEFLSRSVFVQYKWRYEGGYRADSSNVAVFNDIDLGQPKDDYHGLLSGRGAYFAYNADSLDDIWGTKAPLFFVDVVDRPTALEYNWFFDDYDETWLPLGLMPYGSPNSGGGTGEATEPNEFYNYITGTWADGTPLTVGGSGYNPGNPTAARTEIAFPGYPDSTGLWTEFNAQNPPGNRRALLKCGTGISLPKHTNQMLLQYTYMPWEEGKLTERIQHWESEQENLWNQLYCCIDFIQPPPLIGCEYHLFWGEEPQAWTVFPNPANDVIKVWHPDIYLRKMLLFDALGRVLGVGEYVDRYSEISVRNLPTGIYFLQIEDEKGEKKTVKVVVAHGQE